jgi:RNA polymerase sigma factor (sigma-70 family)
MTKERLRKYRDLSKELEQIEQKVETMESALCSPKIQRITGMPSAPGDKNAKEDMMAEHLELLEYYQQKKAELKAEQLAIEKAIESLEYRDRTVLRLYYIDGLTWEQVCVLVNYSWRQVHNIHSAALMKLGKDEEPGE